MDSTSSPLGGLFEFIMDGVRTSRVRCGKGAVRRGGRAPYEEGVSRHPSLAASNFAEVITRAIYDLSVALNQ